MSANIRPSTKYRWQKVCVCVRVSLPRHFSRICNTKPCVDMRCLFHQCSVVYLMFFQNDLCLRPCSLLFRCCTKKLLYAEKLLFLNNKKDENVKRKFCLPQLSMKVILKKIQNKLLISKKIHYWTL